MRSTWALAVLSACWGLAWALILYVLSGRVDKLGQVRSGQVRSGQVRSGQVRSGQVRSGQVRSGQVRSGQVRSGQVRSGQVSPCNLKRQSNFFSLSLTFKVVGFVLEVWVFKNSKLPLIELTIFLVLSTIYSSWPQNIKKLSIKHQTWNIKVGLIYIKHGLDWKR